MPHAGTLAMASRISFLQADGWLADGIQKKGGKTALPGAPWFFPALSGHVENRWHFPSYSRLGSLPGLQLVVLKHARLAHSQIRYRCRDCNSQAVQTVVNNFQIRRPKTISLKKLNKNAGVATCIHENSQMWKADIHCSATNDDSSVLHSCIVIIRTLKFKD